MSLSGLYHNGRDAFFGHGDLPLTAAVVCFFQRTGLVGGVNLKVAQGDVAGFVERDDTVVLLVLVVAIAAGGVVVILYPYVKKLVVEQIIPKAKQIWDEWWGSEESSAQEEEYEEEASFEVLDSISDEGLETAYDRYRENMTDAEAKKELLEAFIMCLAAAKKICRVANADVKSPSGEITQGKLMLEMLTRNNLLDSINSIIENTPSLLEEEEVLKLSELLGVELFQEKEYLPINISTIEKSLREAS